VQIQGKPEEKPMTSYPISVSIVALKRQRRNSKTGKISKITKWRAFVRGRSLPKALTRVFDKKVDAEKWAFGLKFNATEAVALATAGVDSFTLSALITEFALRYKGNNYNLPGQLAFWNEELGSLRVVDITPPHIRAALSRLEMAPFNKRGRKVAKRGGSTLNRYRAALGSVFKFAREEFDLPVDPLASVKRRKEPRGRDLWLGKDSYSDLARLRAACAASKWDRLSLLVEMSLATGARKGELLSLSWRDVDFKERIATLDHTKNGTARILPLPDKIIDDLRKSRGVGDALLFPSKHNPRQPIQMDHHWREAREKAGLENFHFHDLRHTAATLLARRGFGLYDIAGLLGHQSQATTARYAHHTIQRSRVLVDNLAEELEAGR
jgi:integrase